MRDAGQIAETLAERRRAALIADNARRLAAAVPGVAVETTRVAIIVSGRGLLRRWINDARLRDLLRLGR